MSNSATSLPQGDWPPAPQNRPADRPLYGLTVLVVEDSRFSSEALRLLCLRSGARIRRADSLKAAMRHLMTYRPTILIVDMGLPDGNGADLIARFKATERCTPAIIAISGDPENEAVALAAGADAFLCKPIDNLGVFQQKILSCLPPDARPRGLRLVPASRISPDQAALRNDLAHIAQMLALSQDEDNIDYIAGFLAGIARSARDSALQDAAAALALARPDGQTLASSLAEVSGLVQQRLSASGDS